MAERAKMPKAAAISKPRGLLQRAFLFIVLSFVKRRGCLSINSFLISGGKNTLLILEYKRRTEGGNYEKGFYTH